MPVRRINLTTAAYLTFAVFGAFWGVWGAVLPRVRTQAGVDDPQLGVALLFIGGGALPAMLLTGRAVDRWGGRVTAVALALLVLVGVAVAARASSFLTLCAYLACLGAASGATDVAMNALAAQAERISGRPVLTRAAAAFSALVVLGSLTAGPLTVLAGTVAPFAAVAVAGLAVAALLWLTHWSSQDDDHGVILVPLDRSLVAPLLWAGALGALAFASENAYQSWGALYFEQILGARPGWSALAPATFAAVVALTRAGLGVAPERASSFVLTGGALLASVGAGVLAAAHSVPAAVAGVMAAAAGTGGLFPTLLSVAARRVEAGQRGRATALVSTVAYMGFLLGPVYVGRWTASGGLRGAMLAVGALSLLLAVCAVPVLRAGRFMPR